MSPSATLRSALLLLLPALAAAGCAHPPLVNTRWANEAREVQSPDTPGGGPHAVRAEFGPEGDRDTDDLADLHLEENLGHVVVRLDEGVFALESPVLLKGLKSLVLVGQGAHKTRLELATQNKASLLVAGAERVEIRDLTLVGTSGGGIRIKSCPDVRVEGAVFAGARLGLDLEASTAYVGTSTFAGCQQGIILSGGELTVRTTVFEECWHGIDGRGALDVESSAFVDNHDAIPARLDGRGRVVSNLFAGHEQALSWGGRPGVATGNLVSERDLGDRVGERTNRPVDRVEEFPTDLRDGLPPGFDVAGVHLAVERARLRGQANPPAALRDIRLDEARRYAEAAQRALRADDLAAAREAARVALRYLGDIPLDQAAPVVVEVAGLASEG